MVLLLLLALWAWGHCSVCQPTFPFLQGGVRQIGVSLEELTPGLSTESRSTLWCITGKGAEPTQHREEDHGEDQA